MAIDANDIQGMVTHWLACPTNGYLGSDYGSDIEALLFSPLSGGAGDALVAKMRADVPIIGALPPEMIAVYAARDGIDKMRIGVEVAGAYVQLDQGGNLVLPQG